MNTTQRARVAQLPDIARLCLRQLHGAKRPPNPMAFQGPEGHGENIWVFAHRRTDQIIYSFKSTLDGSHDMKQLPFNGKKTRPAKLRKDYWAPMARIAFPRGAGAVGVAAFQKLRELKHLHEVSWADDDDGDAAAALLFKRPLEYSAAERTAAARRAADGRAAPRFTRTKAQRGRALNAQKANAVADMAAVLAGAGPGNKIASSDAKGRGGRLRVSVTWANILDAGHARRWPNNVSHKEMVDPVPEVALPVEAEAEAEAEA